MGFDLHSAVTASVKKQATAHAMAQTPNLFHGAASSAASAVSNMGDDGAVNNTAGFTELRNSLDELITGAIAEKQKVREAEATGDTTMLKDASNALSNLLANKTAYWEDMASGNGPVAVPKDPVLPVWPCQEFCGRDIIVICVFLTGLTFITTGQKLHKYLICAMGMSIGTFAGLVLCDQLDIVELKPKWGLSLALGLSLWIAVMFVESVMFNALGMGIGGTAAMLLFSVVVQYVPGLPAYAFFASIAVGVLAGYFLATYIKNAALTLVYSIKGGFLMGSCVSYCFWKSHLSHGDLWLENVTSHASGLDLTAWPILVSLSSMAVFAVSGVFIQNHTNAPAKKDDKKKEADEKTPLLKGDEEKGVAAAAAPDPEAAAAPEAAN